MLFTGDFASRIAIIKFNSSIINSAAVFADLFDPEGCELYPKPATDYVAAGQPVNFYTVVEAARQWGETAIGYRLRAQAYGVQANPAKSKTITFSTDDRIIVLAES